MIPFNCSFNAFFFSFIESKMSTEMTEAAKKKLNLEKAANFMRQYRDPTSRELKKLSANQFMEVWSHYDKDGESASCFCWGGGDLDENF